MWMDVTGATEPSKRIADPWIGLSSDVIDRFLDVVCLERSISRAERRGMLEDLQGLDGWMVRSFGHTLVTARANELRAYFAIRVSQRRRVRLLARLMRSLHLFYEYLQKSGCREDNAAEALPLWSPRMPRAWAARILTALPLRAASPL